MSDVRLILGDCLEVMATLEENSVDAIVTDPPYGLSFMGKDWDHGIPGVTFWAEALRVAKPGAHLLAFGGTRTWHRLAVAIEDAGWQIRDTVMWVYSQGFPKGHRVDAAVRRHLGADGYCQCGASMRNSANTYPEPQRDAHRHTERPLGDDDHARLDARRLSGEALGSQAGYQPDHDSGDARPRTLQAHGLTSAPLLECAQEHNHSGGRVGGSDCEPEHTPSPVLHTDRLSSLGYSPLESAADGLSANRSASSRLSDTCESAGHIPDTFPSLSRPTSAPEYSTGFPGCPICGKPIPERYEGWNVALKPAWEPIIVARKPLQGTVAANVLAWGTGALNVDGCRVGAEPVQVNAYAGRGPFGESQAGREYASRASSGRWPANLIHDGSDEVVGLFPTVKAGVAVRHNSSGNTFGGDNPKPPMTDMGYGDSGSAARFFKACPPDPPSRLVYCAKASKADRDEGLDGMEATHFAASMNRHCLICGHSQLSAHPCECEAPRWKEPLPRRNHHPTVKPTALMRYLCRLVTPPGGVVLDPFMGSGSTGKAAIAEGFGFVGIEIDEGYFKIAERRIAEAQQQFQLPV